MAKLSKQLKRVGWYEVDSRTVRSGLPESTLQAIHRDVQQVLAKHLLKDEDGDYPVTVSVLDRTRYESNHFDPLVQARLLDDAEGEDAQRLLAGQLRTVQTNQAVLAEQTRRLCYQLEERVRKDSRWGCGCRFEMRPSHEDVMEVRLFACPKHDTKFKLIKRSNKSRL